MSHEPAAVEVVEVGPRDGFQGIGPFIPTQSKLEMLERLNAAGLHRIEIGSFVSATAVPQLRDTPRTRTRPAILPHAIIRTNKPIALITASIGSMMIGAPCGIRQNGTIRSR